MRTSLLHIILFLFFSISALQLRAQSINILWFDSNVTYAPGSGVSVILNPTDTFSLKNTFTLELSGVNGNWQTATPLRTVAHFYLPVFNAVLPANLQPGRYKLRIRTTYPVHTEETPSFEVTDVEAPSLPVLSSALPNNSTYFNCINNSDVAGLMCGSLNQQVGAKTSNMSVAQRQIKITGYQAGNAYEAILLDVFSNNQIPMTINNGSVTIPDNLGLGSYVLQVKSTSGASSIFSALFLFHGNGTNLGNTSSEEICVNHSVDFVVDTSIGGIGRNYPGSKYQINFGDGTVAEEFTQQQLLNHPYITHIFTKASCSETGSSFIVRMQLFNAGVSNSCSAFTKNGNGVEKLINVSVPPRASFNAPQKACLGKSVYLENTTIPGFYGKVGCKEASNFYWYYKKPGDDDFAVVSNSTWVDTKGNLTMPASEMTQAGCWTFKIEAQNQDLCQMITDIEKKIIIEAMPVVAFEFSSDSVCLDTEVILKNTSNQSESDCSKPQYQWKVTPKSASNTGAYVLNASNMDATVKFTKPGVYGVQLQLVNACGTYTTDVKDVYVAGGATVTFPVDSVVNCVPASAMLKVDFSQNANKPLYNTNYGKIASYNWTISGNNVSPDDYRFVSATTAKSPYPVIEFNPDKKYIVRLQIASDCVFTNSDSMLVHVKTIPEVLLTSLTQTVCSNDLTNDIVLADANSTVRFRWTVQGTPNVTTGLTNGEGNVIKASIVQNNSDSIAEIRIAIIADNGTCQGSVVNYVITVLPRIYAEKAGTSEFCLGADNSFADFVFKNGTAPYTVFYRINGGDILKATTEAGSDTLHLPVNTGKISTYNYEFLSVEDADNSTCNMNQSVVFKMEVLDNPLITTQPQAVQEVCIGALPDTLRVECSGVTSGRHVQWYRNTENANYGGNAIAGANELYYLPTGVDEIGNYYFYCKITVNGTNCGNATSDVAQVKVNPLPLITGIVNKRQSTCVNGQLDALQVTVAENNGTLKYQWYSATDTVSAALKLIKNATTDKLQLTSTVVGKKFYFCQVYQSIKGCDVLSEPFEVQVYKTPVITQQPNSGLVCLSDSTHSLQVKIDGGGDVVNYQWYSCVDALYGQESVIKGATSSKLSLRLQSGGIQYYFCRITFGTNNCASLQTKVAEINILNSPEISDKSLQVVSGESFDFIPVATDDDILPIGTFYSWTVATPSNPVSGYQASSVAMPAVSGKLYNRTDSVLQITYVVVPEIFGCSGTAFNLKINVLPEVYVKADVRNISCANENDGSIRIEVYGGRKFIEEGGYQINWTGPDGFVSDKMELSGLRDGEYSLTVTDATGLAKQYVYRILRPDALSIVVDSVIQLKCFAEQNAVIRLHVNGGIKPFNYKWTKNGNIYSTENSLTNCGVGEYQLVVTDSNHCEVVSDVFRISEPEEIEISIDKLVHNQCYGAAEGAISVNVKGGTPFTSSSKPAYHFFWKGPDSFSSDLQTIDSLKAGVYELIVTDSLNCVGLLTVSVNQENEIQIEVEKSNGTCYNRSDASVELKVTGGIAPYEATWSNYATGLIQQNLSPGLYQILVSDARGCSKSIQIEIQEEQTFVVDPVVKNVSCKGENDGSIHLNIKATNKYLKVKWLDGSTAGADRNNLVPGVYDVEVSDGGPCVLRNTFVITEPEKLVVKAMVNNVFECNNASSGAISLNVEGGTEPYKFLWSTGEVTKDITNLKAGKYFVTVTDTFGCSATELYEVIKPETLKADITLTMVYDASCMKYKQVCTATIVGGTGPYNCYWSGGLVDDSKMRMETTESQTYSFKVTDAAGCESVVYFNTNVIQANIKAVTTDCNARVYAFDVEMPENEVSGADFEWSFGDNATSALKSPTHLYLGAGTYKVLLKIKTQTAQMMVEKQLTVEDLPTLSLNREPKFCTNDSVEIKVTGASTYLWNDGTSSDTKVIKKAGTYSVTGTTANGCYSTLYFTASEYENQTYSIYANKQVVTQNEPEISLWTDNVAMARYSWDLGDGTSDEGANLTHKYDINVPGSVKIKLHVVSPDGCNSTVEKLIWKVMDNIPNTFTPNGDGVNDRFMAGVKMQVFNSNGVVLYEGSEGWDGTFKGQPVLTDTYYYMLFYDMPEGVVKKPGFVFIAR